MVELGLELVPLDDDLTQYARVLAESCFAVHNDMVAKIVYYKTCQRIIASDAILFSEFCNQAKPSPS